ncbi:hypothetical protein KL949_001707 [Ogataea haglerorum]|uniref:uncharacterized protein n=1 Tax=Ogataea haglerorum TaxID=1937702 RepID=UPI001C8A2EA0|nr:uncharacterized protein KL911_000209 [Ogataea haglerorum]KAG7700629.1 hypothetical protein KL951_000744 [Ogataea haglerorum]KAG7720449.1 hypothetical protein KL913_001349 [Ogataea haglerorum]KAG7720835.1 hypothetical protein KL949_001707 [Ogataea haglerorum]KAG7733916.1 hypothetical protein KL948_001118 [Ogataea haglerorum]KAG7748447.1 hypothetical protein KL912_002352 [Ogataea haglerorum]
MLSTGWSKLSGAFSAVHVLPKRERTPERVQFSTKWFLSCLAMFVIFNFVSIFQQTTFMCQLPAVNLVRVLNNGDKFIDSGKLYFKENYDEVRKDNIELYNSLSKIFEMQKNSYLKSYDEYALILNPLFILDEAEVRIKFHPMKYYFKNKSFEFKNSTIPILEFKRVFGHNLTPLRALRRPPLPYSFRLHEHHQDTNEFLHKIVYPIYESSGYDRTDYSLDSLLDYSFVLKYINFGVFLISLIFFVEALSVVVPYSLKYHRVFSIPRVNQALFVLAIICFVSCFMLMSVNIVLNLILVGKESNDIGVVSTLMGFIQLFWLVFIAFQTKTWIWKVYLENKYPSSDYSKELETQGERRHSLGGFGIRPLSFGSIKRRFTLTLSPTESPKDSSVGGSDEHDLDKLLGPHLYTENLHGESSTDNLGSEFKAIPGRSIRSIRSARSIRSLGVASISDRDPFTTALPHQPGSTKQDDNRSLKSSRSRLSMLYNGVKEETKEPDKPENTKGTEIVRVASKPEGIFVEDVVTCSKAVESGEEDGNDSGTESEQSYDADSSGSSQKNEEQTNSKCSISSLKKETTVQPGVPKTKESDELLVEENRDAERSTTRISTAASESFEHTQEKEDDSQDNVS